MQTLAFFIDKVLQSGELAHARVRAYSSRLSSSFFIHRKSFREDSEMQRKFFTLLATKVTSANKSSRGRDRDKDRERGSDITRLK